MLDYSVKARRIDGARSIAYCAGAEIVLDTGKPGGSGEAGAFNPAELFLASIAACMIKGIERVSPMLDFDYDEVEIILTAHRQDSPPKLVSVDYEILVGTDEDDRRLDLLHNNVRKFGTVTNTVCEALTMTGTLTRRPRDEARESAEHQAAIERVAEISRKQLETIPAPGTDVLHEGP